ncbi:MAG TPA: type VI secretion system baseplate subunit TssF [Methylomirabilota bacterium]|nr:type VI secretion system baseplate subunit TssF [Methylomirabilota bacterium]
MNREFLDLYNRELALLKEQASEFAEEYPGVADRLGGLLAERTDPMIEGLLQGAAFLAARVQLKLENEYAEFTSNLLEQLVPHYLAPAPSVMLVEIDPPYAEPALREGMTIARGTYLDANSRERERGVSCRFQLTGDLTLWPFQIVAAEYHAAAAPLQALGLPIGGEALAGLRLTLTMRTTERAVDEPPDTAAFEAPQMQFSACQTDSLTVHLLGAEGDAVALYEQLFAHASHVYFRTLDAFGDPVVIDAGAAILEQIGFSEDETLIPRDSRVFHGFDLLRDYFLFPRKYLGFRLCRLAPLMARLKAKTVEIIVVFDEVNPRLAAAVRPEMFALHAAPAVNLFEKTVDRIQIKPNQHEFHVVPDRSRALDFEPHRILSVHAHIAGDATRVPVSPVYAAGLDDPTGRPRYTYSVRRMPRRRSSRELRFGSASDYIGTEMFMSVGDGSTIDTDREIAELSVRALCSNRHLTEQLPVGRGDADFTFLDDTTLVVRCVSGPTPPREPVVSAKRSRTEQISGGEAAWRLINMLGMNQLGLVSRAGGAGAATLREALSLFADVGDNATDRRIRGIRQVDAKPTVRRLRQAQGVGVARGLEVRVLLDERAFEGSGVFLMGAVLDRFLAEYVTINSFTQTVVLGTERGEIMRWPARAGRKGVL